MSNDAPDGPGPLIWVVLLISAMAGAIWGLGVAAAAFVATTALFVLVGKAMQKRLKWRGHTAAGSATGGTDYEERMSKAASRDERRWIFARELAGSPGKLIEEVEGTIDWFATVAADMGQQSLGGSSIRSRITKHAYRGAATASFCKLLALTDNADTRLCAGLLLHHIAPMMTMSEMGMSDEMTLQALEKEQADFMHFVGTCEPSLAQQIRVTLDRSEKVAADTESEVGRGE